MSPLSPASSSITPVAFKDAGVQVNPDSRRQTTYAHSEIARVVHFETEQLQTRIEKAQNEIEVQFEQVKADLDHTLMNELKRVDKRLQSLESSLESLQESKSSTGSQALNTLVALSIVLSFANLIMLFVKH